MKKVKDPTAKANVLTELINTHMQRFDNTRKIQWTFNSLFWTGIIVTTPFLKNAKDYNPDANNNYLVYTLFIVGAYFIILILFQRSLNWDKNKFKHYRKNLENLISFPRQENKEIIPWSVVWSIAQLIVTILLLTGVYFIVRN